MRLEIDCARPANEAPAGVPFHPAVSSWLRARLQRTAERRRAAFELAGQGGLHGVKCSRLRWV
jgi:hypothetical protein